MRRRYPSARAHGDAIGPDSVADAYHDLRIAIKRLRYTLEVTDPDPEALRVLRGLQDVLGEHQDACVAETRLRELAAGVELAEGVRPEVVRIADERGELAASLRAAFPEPYAAFRRRRPPT